MIYQNPNLLYALFAIAIPIFIHLFNLRKYKVIHFSSLRFLKEIKDENKRKSDLKNILILISRIFAIIFLVLAFSKPFIPVQNSLIKKDIFIYIDNSLSMDIDFGNGNLLNIAKSKANEISKAYSEESNFYLITNDFNSKHNYSYSYDAIRLQIEEISSTSKARSFSSILSRLNSISNNSHLYFISDFQKSTFNSNEIEQKNLENKISFVPVTSEIVPNINIDSIYISEPIFINNREVELSVKISNTSDKDIIDDVVFLYVKDVQKSQKVISLLAKETKEIIFQFPNTVGSFINGHIQINDIPISFDNKMFFSISELNKINIYCINQNKDNSALIALFDTDTSLFKFKSSSINNINFNSLPKEDLIILNEVHDLSNGFLKSLLSFASNGGSIIIIPPSKFVDKIKYNKMLSYLNLNQITSTYSSEIKINRFIAEHPVLENIFLNTENNINYPVSQKYYRLNRNKVSSSIIGLANGDNFLSSISLGSGTIYQFSSPFNVLFSNFTNHALFVPTLLNIASSSIQLNNIFYTIGSKNKIQSNSNILATDLVKIKGNSMEIIPTISINNGKHNLDDNNQIIKNGIYTIINNNEIVDYASFNYNINESHILALTLKELKNFISFNNLINSDVFLSEINKMKSIIKEKEIGKEYWKIALIISLFFFGLEILFLKLNKS